MITKLMTILSLTMTCAFADMPEPIAEKIPTKLIKHGDVRIDNYFWMKNKANPKLIAHLKAENAYREEAMKDTKELQEKLYLEMRARIKEEDQSVPFKLLDYLYYNKTLKGQEYPVFCRKKNTEKSPEETILDVNILAKGFDTIHVSTPAIHFDQNLMAYGVDTRGDRVFTIYFKDLATGQLLPLKIENVTENYTWAEAGKVLFYAKHDPKTLRSNKIYKYDLEKKVHTFIYEEKDEKFETAVYKTQARNLFL